MFSFRVPFRSIPQSIKYFAKQRPNVRFFASTVIDLEPQVIYPNKDKQLGKYLDHLSKQTNESNLNEIRRKYAVRNSIVQQMVELENEMKDENNAEILNMALDEKRVSEMN